MKTNTRTMSMFAGLLLVFWVSLFTGLSANSARGQSVTVTPLPSGGTACKELQTLPGDKLLVNTRHTYNPDVISRVRVSIYAGNTEVLGYVSYDGDNFSDNVIVEHRNVVACIGVLSNLEWYLPQYPATTTVSVTPRTNLTAVAPTVSSNGDISYGYRLGSILWNPRGHRVTTQLAYYNSSTNQYAPIAECTMQIATNASFSCPAVNASQVPTVPGGTTHLVTRVDRFGVVPETNENDNNALSDLPKPNLRITNVAYDPDNNIKVFFRLDSLLPLSPTNVQLKLNYAKGTQFSNIIDDYRALMEHDFSLQGIERNREYQFQADRGGYPLPTSDATHLMASIDLPDNRLVENNENDNIRTAPVQIAPGYTQVPYGRGGGVSVYKKGNFYIVVADLNKATLANSLKTEWGLGIGHHFRKGLRGNTGRRKLKVAINGTFFQAPLGGLLPAPIEPSGFHYGLKRNGRILNVGSSVPITGSSDFSIDLFTFNRNSVASIPHHAAPFFHRSYQNLIGTISDPPTPSANPAIRTDPRNVIGFRDPIRVGAFGEPRFQTMVAFLTKQAITLASVKAELARLGIQKITQLDGGASTALMVANGSKGIPLIRSARPFPNGLLFFGGQQPTYRSSLALTSNNEPLVEDPENETLETNTDFIAIKKSGTGSGTTEFSVLSGEGDFVNIYNQLPTGIHQTDDNYQFLLGDLDRDGYNDLFVIKKLGVSSTEIHVLSGASGYKKYLFQSATGLHRTNAYWKFALTDWDNDNRPDLVAMSRAGGASGKAEAHILSAASNYQQFILHAVTPLPSLDFNFDLQVGDWDGDSRPDLIAVKRNGVSSTELHIVSGASNLTQYALQSATALHKTDSTWSFAVTDWDGGGKADLVGFKKQNTGTNSTEIHVLQGETQFQNFILQIGTALPHAGAETELLVADNSAMIGDFDPSAKKYIYNQDGIYLFRNNEILEYSGQAPTGWRQIDNNASSTDVVSTSSGLYQFHRQSGFVYWFNKAINNWQEISNNIAVTGIAATNDDLYVRNSSGAFFKYNGAPYGWTLVSQDNTSLVIGATDDSLFQMHTTGRILRWNGSGWTTVSTSYSTRQMVTTADEVFVRRDTGELLAYDGDAWITISNPDGSVSNIYADGETIYRQHHNGHVYRYTDTPLTGWRLVKW